MTRLEEQIRELSPTVKDALYRRLMFAEDLAWLRNEKRKGKVIGFEVDLDGQELSGFALIAIQRHTVIAFVSERNEQPRLILFPALEILFDPGFELLDLNVTRKEFSDSAFNGVPDGHGRFGDMVKDLTPPERRMDIPDIVVAQMADNIKKEEEQEKPQEQKEAVISPAPAVPRPQPVQQQTEKSPDPGYEEDEYEEGPPEGFDEEQDFDNYQEPGAYDDDEGYYDEEPDNEPDNEPDEEQEQPAELSRSDQLRAQTFNSLSEITDYVNFRLHIDRPLAVTLVNKAMQSKVSPEYRIQLAVNIFCKLMDEGKI